MHEISICQRILEESKKAGAKKSISIEVGELAVLSGNEIISTIKDLDPKMRVEIKEIKNKILCPKCNSENQANILEKGHGYSIYECSSCQNKKDLKILQGGEIRIVEVE